MIDVPAAASFFPIANNHRLHYLDSKLINPNMIESDRAIICVHGNPSWSWYFRHFFHAEQKRRILSLDHLGMGLSSKVNQYFSIKDHADNLLNFLKYKKIKSVDLVVHDWGGIIAMLALQNSEIKITSIVGMNTSFFPRKNFPWRIYLTTRPAWNKFLNKDLGVFSKAASYMATHFNLSKENRQAYLYPYQHSDQRQGITNFLSDIPWSKHSKNYQLIKSCENFIKQLNIPMMAVWGLRDFCFDETYLNYWKQINPQLEVHKFFDAGHWCFEDKTSEVLNLLEKFWCRL